MAVPYQSAVECRGPEDSEGDMDYVRTASVNNPSTKQVASNNRTRRSPDELLKLGVLWKMLSQNPLGQKKPFLAQWEAMGGDCS